MALSYVDFTSVTGTGPYSYGTILLLLDSQVAQEDQLVVTVNDVVQTYDATPVAGEYSLDKDASTLTLGTALVSADTLRIARVTKRDGRYVDYVNNSPISADDLDLDSDQLLFIAQESIDGTSSAQLGEYGGTIKPLAARAYTLSLKSTTSGNFTVFSARTDAGTCTAVLSIDGVDVTDGTINATTSIQTVTPSALNFYPAGALLELTVGAVVTAAELEITIGFSRTG